MHKNLIAILILLRLLIELVKSYMIDLLREILLFKRTIFQWFWKKKLLTSWKITH